jgi:hypothetical protein
MGNETSWNSLEIAKLAVSILTPLLLVYLGYVVSRTARRVEQAQWANRKLIERRLELYNDMAPSLNDMYCFFALVGDFKAITPARAVALKRDLDKSFQVNQYLFSQRFASAYQGFIGKCFAPYSGGVGHAARILASPHRQRSERADTWREEWVAYFADESRATPIQLVQDAYQRLMEQFARELKVREGDASDR